MQSQFFGHSATALSTSVANFFPANGGLTSPNATEANRNQCVIACATTISNFYVSIDTAPTSGKSYTFTIRKNGADTVVSVVIADSATTGSDSTHSVSLAAGDILTIGCTPSGTPSAPTVVNWNFVVNTGGNVFCPIIGGVNTTSGLSTSVATYGVLTGTTTSSSGWSATEPPQQIVIPCAGTLDNLYVVSSGAAGSGASYALALVQNGSGSALTCTISGVSATTANDTTHSVAVTAGDTLSISVTPSGTPTARFLGWGMRFTPTTNGQSFFGFGSSSAPSQTTTQYELPLGAGAGGWNATQANRQIIVGATTLQAFYVSIGVAAGIAKTRTLTVYDGGSSTALTVAITGVSQTTGNITGQSVSIAQGDLISIQCADSGTPAVDTGGVHTGILMYTAPSATNQGFLGMFS